MRLIDGDALIETVHNSILRYLNESGGGYYLAEDAIEDIESAPTIDPSSLVKRGRWEEHPCGDPMCSECKERLTTEQDLYGGNKFCPYCGALMED